MALEIFTMRDNVFAQPIEKKFEFDQAVASVFDDMLSRSVPFYDEVRSLVIAVILAEAREGMRVVDLGSSTAKFLLELHARSGVAMELTGIDNSEAMVERARQKAQAFGAKDVRLELGDILTHDYSGYDVAVSNYTLQFIRPMQRMELVSKIGKELSDGGMFVFSEKVVFGDKRLDKQMIDIYYDFKRARGYSDFEISQKREALENVLIPFTIDENIKMCNDAGFMDVSTIFQWGNFVTFVARKG
jgi:tRNA (cmo5U34)-methyltransferase